MAIGRYDLFRCVFRKQPDYCLNVMLVSLMKSETSIKEKPQCWLIVTFDSKVTRSCDKNYRHH